MSHLLGLVHTHGSNRDGLVELCHAEEVAKSVLGDAVADNLPGADDVIDQDVGYIVAADQFCKDFLLLLQRFSELSVVPRMQFCLIHMNVHKDDVAVELGEQVDVGLASVHQVLGERIVGDSDYDQRLDGSQGLENDGDVGFVEERSALRPGVPISLKVVLGAAESSRSKR